jgi:hypothetical protein
MTAAAKAKIDNLAMGLPPLSLRDLNALVGQLPAAERATLAWAPAAIEAELDRLRSEPLDADLISQTTVAIFTHFSRALTSIVRVLGTRNFLTEIKNLYHSEGQRLDRFLPDSGARRSAGWAMRAFLGVLEAVLLSPEIREASLHPDPLAHVDLSEAFKDDAAGVLRAVVLLMAAVSIAEHDGDKERAAELADRAFLEASRGVDRMASLGLSMELKPEAGSSPSERGRRVLECVEEARAILTSEDVTVLSQARLRELR